MEFVQHFHILHAVNKPKTIHGRFLTTIFLDYNQGIRLKLIYINKYLIHLYIKWAIPGSD